MRRVTWMGHAAFRIDTSKVTVFIDPWIDGNPKSPIKHYKEVEKADLVLVTHDHSDHGYKDAINICIETGATFVAVFELAERAGADGVENVAAGNIGGEIAVGETRIYFANAIHSSEIAAPCGFVVVLPGLTIYHTGDTAFYSDMACLGKLYDIDAMILPICSKFMMGPQEAAWAVEKVRPKIAIPCHYDTFPFLKQDPSDFKKLVGTAAAVEILEIGEASDLSI